MSLLAPFFFGAAAFTAAAVVALHFLARSQPQRTLFPTARFVPESRERAPSRSITPHDLLLLALRVIAVLLLGLAFARPTLTAARRPLGRVVVVDRSRAVASFAAAADSARAWLRDGDRLVVFDSVARAAGVDALDSVRRDVPTAARGSLGAALVQASREAARVRDTADSVEVVVVSPLAAEEWDAATGAVRATWPGGVRLVRLATARVTPDVRTIAIRGAAADPLRATLALMAATTRVPGAAQAGAERVRIVRDARLLPVDSAWARAGGVLIHWPAGAAGSGRRDTVGAVVVDSVVLAAPFVRQASAPGGMAVARWVDGEPAATERALGAGCVREIRVPLDRPGDIALRSALRRVVAAMAAPCGGVRDFAPLAATQLDLLAGNARPVASAAFAAAPEAGRALAPWLIALALLGLVAEQLWRRRSTES